ncbi:unnamed protein product [Diamesa tonsa]
MLADETFPEVDFDGDTFLKACGSDFDSTELLCGDSSADIMLNSIQIERLILNPMFKNDNDFQNSKLHESELLENSIEGYQNKRSAPPFLKPIPGAPIKKKKSQSCQDLMQAQVGNRKSSNNKYDHVESKVKRIIQEAVEDEKQRKKTLARHKSMPISSQPAMDDPFNDEMDLNSLKNELRKHTAKITELEERCEYKDTRIYELDYDRKHMKMKFDVLRLEIHELKEEKSNLIGKLALSPSSQKSASNSFRNASIQTESPVGESPAFIETSNEHINEPRVVRCRFDERLSPANSIIRELSYSEITFNNQTRIMPNTSLGKILFNFLLETNFIATRFYYTDLTIFSCNTSSDNLIAEDTTMETPAPAERKVKKQKKSKKKLKQQFLKLIPCLS